MIPEEVIEQIREQADLVGLIGESVNLRRTGADYRGPCPFHGGAHRNFAVIPRKGIYYCYVCHESGDVFTWFMKRQGLDYPSAVREAGQRSGIAVPESSARETPDHREPLFSAMEVAREHYARALREGADAEQARRYLTDREIPPESAFEMGLGYAPRPPAPFFEAMRTLGISDQVLVDAGLAVRRDDGLLRARFRDRLLFPIHDLRGRTVAFGGRLLGPGEPKYLNSPDTDIFHKGTLLYHLHAARHAIRSAGFSILVEGYVDVVRLLLVGVDHVVAPMGTGLTPDQAALLKRFAPTVILLYDSDTPGLRATFRAGDELLQHGLQVRVATLPAGEDPDTFVRRNGAPALEALLDDAVDLFDRKIQLLERKGWFERLDQRREAVDRLLPTIRATTDPIVRDLYLGRLSERVGVSRESLLPELEAGRSPSGPAFRVVPPVRGGERGAPGQDRPAPPSPSRPHSPGARAQARLLHVCLARPEWKARLRTDGSPDLFDVPAYRAIAAHLTQDDDGEPAVPSLSEDHAAVLARLQEEVRAAEGLDWDAEYDAALSQLRDEAQIQAYLAATDPHQKRTLLETMSPTARQRFVYRRTTRGAAPGRSRS